MLVEKNGVKFTLNNQTQIDAFLADGYTEVTAKATPKVAEAEPTVKPEAKTVKKAVKTKATK